MNVKLVVAALLLLMATKLSAQEEKIYQEKMNVFGNWAGQWHGSGWMQTGPGEPKKFAIDEAIQFKLEGTIIMIEGIGKGNDGQGNNESIVHHALAILSYERQSDQYKFRSHLKNGRSTDAWFTIASENKYQWGFDTPQGKVRYYIAIDPIAKTWNEFGEFATDGNTWRKFMEMNLTKN